jgi:hypothetical protein
MSYFIVCGGEIGLMVHKSYLMCSQCAQVLLTFWNVFVDVSALR